MTKSWSKLNGIALLLIFVPLATSCQSQPSPAQVGRDWIAALSERDISKVEELTCEAGRPSARMLVRVISTGQLVTGLFGFSVRDLADEQSLEFQVVHQDTDSADLRLRGRL